MASRETVKLLSLGRGEDLTEKLLLAALAYMPTFPTYAGFSRFEAVKKLNPDIPIF
jgi:hypothetical protein